MKSGQAIPRKTKETLSKAGKDGEIILMRLDDDNRLFKIHGLAVEVWKQIDGKKTLGQISASVARRFKCPAIPLLADSQKFVRQLKKARLIQTNEIKKIKI